MVRFLTGIGLTICTLVCVSAVVAWSRSYRFWETFSWEDPDKGAAGFAWSKGSILVAWGPGPLDGGIVIRRGFYYYWLRCRNLDPGVCLPDCWLAPQHESGPPHEIFRNRTC